MTKIVLFIEPNADAFFTPLKIGNLFMNRFAIDEDAASEILKIFELEKTSIAMSYPKHRNYENSREERKQKGKDLNNEINRLNCFTIINKNEFCIEEIFANTAKCKNPSN